MVRLHRYNVVTNYCVVCGQSALHIAKEGLECIDPTNVTAISHKVSQKRIHDIRPPSKSDDPDSK